MAHLHGDGSVQNADAAGSDIGQRPTPTAGAPIPATATPAAVRKPMATGTAVGIPTHVARRADEVSASGQPMQMRTARAAALI
jgi:hypothetical protein